MVPLASQTAPEVTRTESRQVHLTLVWQTVRKYWATALATCLSVALSVAFYTLGQTRIYQATALVQLDPNPPRPLGKSVDMVVDLGTGTYWNNREYYETQYKIIQSARVAGAVVQQLGLHRDAAFLKNKPGSDQRPDAEVSAEVAADVLRARLQVEPVKDSRLTFVRFEDADPQRAQKVLNAVLTTYRDQNLENANASTSSAVVWLTEQVDKLRQELESNERALHQYKLDKNILSLDPDAQSNMLREEMKQLNDELTSVRARREAVSAQRTELSKVRLDDPSNLPAAEFLGSPMVQQLRERYEEANRERESLKASGKGDGHPDVAAANARSAAAKAAILAEVRNVQRAVDKDLAALTRQQAGLSALYEAAKRKGLELNLLEVDYNRLRRSRDNTEKLYSLVLERTKESDLARMMSVNNISIVDRPTLPRAPVRPRVPLNIAIGILCGIGLGVAAAMMRGLADRTLRTPADVEGDLGLTFLGLLPEIGSKSTLYGQYYGRRRKRDRSTQPPQAPELIVHHAPTSSVAEAARAIRTNLLFMSPDRPFRVLLVTSPAPSEGKTTVATSIAVAMAQAGQRVVLVDCDLRRPRVHRVFGRKNDVGVTTALLEGTPAETVAFETEVPNLWVTPAGPLPPNPAELLHSDRFKAYLKDLAEHFDRVIVDSPPVVTVTDGVVLSTLVDGVVLVARAFATPKDTARHSARAIRDVGGNVIGMVLNAVNLDRHEYKHYYYYYRRDHEYYAQNEAEPAPRAE